MTFKKTLAAGILLAGTSLATAPFAGASANTLTAAGLANAGAILGQFNLVNFGNYAAGNETEGRIVVGGNFNANTNHNACFNGCAGNTVSAINGQQYGAVTVFGNVTGGFNTGSANGQADAYIHGTAAGTFDFGHKGNFNVVGSATGAHVNNPKDINTSQATFAGVPQNADAVHTGVAAATVFPYGTDMGAAFLTPLANLTSALTTLPTAAGVTVQALPNPPGGNLSFTAGADYLSGGRKYGVITTTLANLATEQNFFGINNNGNDATFVIVTGDGAGFSLPNLNSNNDESRVIWAFVDAATLKFSGGWYGTILAPYATITQQGGDLTGSVVVQSLNQSNELHANYLFAGDLTGLVGLNYGGQTIPEPSSLVAIGIGALGLGIVRRRGQRKPGILSAA
jgi:choice-of-anchor A domain-containing protein